jgi:glycosyltransferase involved in cell wall biosynthesis
MARICLVRQGYFPLDPRVSREVQALVEAGHEVDILCAGLAGQPRLERSGAITLHRLPIKRRRGNPVRYLFEFTMFFVWAALLITALHLRRRYDVVQVNTVPDTHVFAALVPRLLGARVLLDLHECMPEFFATKYRLPPRHAFVRLLGGLEQASIRFAHSVITCTEPMRARFVARGARPEKIAVILNSANEDVFDCDRPPRSDRSADQFVLICHGTIEEIFGVDTIVRAVALLGDRIPGLRLEIYGDGSFRPTIEALVSELGVAGRVSLSRGFVPMTQLIDAIASADAGVVPTKRDDFRDLTHCNKMFDFIAMRKPAIVARTPAVEAYFDESCFQMFESRNEQDLARAIVELHADPDLRERLVRRASEVSEPYRWIHQRPRYLEVVERLVHARARVAPARAPERLTAAEPVEDL